MPSPTSQLPITIYQLPPSSLRIWLVHDWLTGWRGGEKILLELVRLFPNARIATLLHFPNTTHPEIDARVAQTSFLQKFPFQKHYRNYLPLFPRAIRSLKLDQDADLVLSISHAVAKGIVPPINPKTGKRIPHLCYCNTPMRYIWGLEDQYVSKLSPKRLALKLATPGLRRFDLKNDNVTQFIGNSHNVADRIRRFYHREALTIYAGIEHDYFTLPPDPSKPRENFYLCAGALVPYKRIDLAIAAVLPPHRPRELKIIGTGPESSRLRALAKNAPNITFLGRQPDDILRDHYQRCRAFLFPGEEDFGLTPVEAQSCGSPIIAYAAGGILETTLPKETALLYTLQETGLPTALAQFESDFFPKINPQTCHQNSLRFNWPTFRSELLAAISQTLQETQTG